MRDPHKDISFWVEIAGQQGEKIWDFTRQTNIRTYTLRNVPTWVLDARDPFVARNGSMILAKVVLKCEKTPHGLLKCSETSTKDKPVFFNKVFVLQPKLNTPMRIKRFLPNGTIIIAHLLNEIRDEMEMSIPFNLIPITGSTALPNSMSATHTSTEGEESGPSAIIPPSRFDIYVDPQASSSNTTPPTGVSTQAQADTGESVLQAGILHAPSTGEIILPLASSGSRPPAMDTFSPLATSTTEERRQQQGSDAIRPPLIDLLEASPSSRPFLPAGRLSRPTVDRVTVGRVTKLNKRKRRIILRTKGKPYYQTYWRKYRQGKIRYIQLPKSAFRTIPTTPPTTTRRRFQGQENLPEEEEMSIDRQERLEEVSPIQPVPIPNPQELLQSPRLNPPPSLNETLPLEEDQDRASQETLPMPPIPPQPDSSSVIVVGRRTIVNLASRSLPSRIEMNLENTAYANVSLPSLRNPCV